MMQNRSDKKLKIAITGGYASGKSSVLKRFIYHGFTAISADEVYQSLQDDADFVEKISRSLEVDTITKDGKIALDKNKISELVFSNRHKLELLNSITHKEIYEKMNEIFSRCDGKKVVFEIPLLFESQKQDEFDVVIIVMRERSQRVKFGALRDNISQELAERRIKNQFDYDKISKDKHTFIYNNGDKNALNSEVDRLIEGIKVE